MQSLFLWAGSWRYCWNNNHLFHLRGRLQAKGEWEGERRRNGGGLPVLLTTRAVLLRLLGCALMCFTDASGTRRAGIRVSRERRAEQMVNPRGTGPEERVCRVTEPENNFFRFQLSLGIKKKRFKNLPWEVLYTARQERSLPVFCFQTQMCSHSPQKHNTEALDRCHISSSLCVVLPADTWYLEVRTCQGNVLDAGDMRGPRSALERRLEP